MPPLTERDRGTAEFAAILDAALDAVVRMDARGLIIGWNAQAAAMFGWSAAEAIGRQLADTIIPPRSRDAHDRGVAHFVATGEGPILGRRIEIDALHRDGHEFPVELAIIPLETAGGWHFSAFVRDITARRQADRVQQAIYRIAQAANTPAGLPELLRDVHAIVGQLLPAKNLYVALHDRQRNMLTFPYWVDEHDPVPDPYPLGRGLTEYVLRTGEPLLTNNEVDSDLMRRGEVEVTGAPSLDWIGVPLRVQGSIIGVLVVQTYSPGERYGEREKDILQFVSTQIAMAIDRKRAEEELRLGETQLRQSQKMEAVGQLAGGIAHDFNNLLTAITGYSDLLLEDLAPNDPRRLDIDEIRAAARRAASLTQQLLAFSRKQVLQPRVLSLNEVVTNAEKLLRRLIGEDIALQTRLDPAIGAIMADPAQLEQVIVNLAVNARDAMPNGGRLVLGTANVTFDAAGAAGDAVVPAGAYVQLTVSDTGMGMDDETKARLFEPFYTTKGPGKGTGLGLSTVYGIVKQSGGFIWVNSEPARGTTFDMCLPRVDAAVEELTTTARAQDVPRGTETILLVEDEPALRTVARRALERQGYVVLEAADADTALGLASRHHGPLDLLVTDVVMPGGSGPELATRLVAARPHVKVLYMSGYTDEAIVHHGVLEAGVAYLGKPFSPDDLGRRVRAELDGKS